ncbi:LTA synthase family protein [Candidatus Bandiella euplotis]|nr:LTA synthase family protein [Candidatus Bandiella woodruffii]
MVAEYFFWDEFGVRFNFIAVDYLVYQRELVGNIYESYPLIKILVTLVFLVPIFYYVAKSIARKFERFRTSKLFVLNLSLIVVLCLMGAYHFNPKDVIDKKFDGNAYATNLAYNGLDGLFSAFKNNTLDYDKFYLSYDQESVLKNLRQQISSGNAKFLSNDTNDITRIITSTNGNKSKKHNVALIVVESLSAEFMGYFGNREGITPFLDSLVAKSLFFNNFYATGTRTVRGLEAISLSIPPLPGNSILRRPSNENLFSLGYVFEKEGYDNKFIYGGFGYFDNMNYFFANNNFKTIDRTDFAQEEITFSNVWGVSDEDLFNKFIKEADKSHKAKQPFLSLVMTTSNHRPYTYLDGKIDILPGTGRAGAVKYTDYAIKQLMERSKQKPWFDNTIFIIVADHCAGSAGKVHIPVDRYHIPLFIYAPKIIKPKIIDDLASQIDIAPTLLGLLDVEYKSKFFGKDILKFKANRAFISTYQKLGLYSGNTLTVLGPKKFVWSYNIDQANNQKENKVNKTQLFDTVTFYQAASHLLNNGWLKDISK